MKKQFDKILMYTLIGFGGLVFLFGVLLLPQFANQAAIHYPELAHLKIPALVVVYLTLGAFYVVLAEGVKICKRIVQDDPFSEGNLKSFKISAISAGAVAAVYALGIVAMAILSVGPFVMYIVCTVISLCALVVSLLCAVLNELLKKAIALRIENELTV